MLSQKKLAQKIKKLRLDFDMSQAELASKIGLSRVAVAQIEASKRSIDSLELAKIAQVFGTSVDYLLIDEKNKVEKKANKKQSQVFKFDQYKLKNVILYILQKCGGKPNLGETVLYKLLYFIDFDAFEILGKPVTNMNYIKLQFGPVPCLKDYNSVIEQMVKNDELKIISQTYHGMPQKRYISLVDPDLSIFKKAEEIKLIDKVINNLSDMNAKQIEDYVHEDTPWKIAKEKEIIPYYLVYDRTAPYAQADHWAEWQNAAGKDILKELGPISKEEYDYYENL